MLITGGRDECKATSHCRQRSNHGEKVRLLCRSLCLILRIGDAKHLLHDCLSYTMPCLSGHAN